MSDGAENLKSKVHAHWEKETCGTRYGLSKSRKDYFDEITQTRYTLEPYILDFANFPQAKGKRVLEIGVGAGTDFYHWVSNGAIATGIDLTESAIALTRERLELSQVPSNSYELRVADAENLPFEDQKFDIIYSWGVLHHTPNTELAFKEVFRILKPGGILKAMIYHIPSWTGWMLWVQHALLKAKLFQPVKQVIFNHLESPGTKAYTVAEARRMLMSIGFEQISISTKLGSGDLLMIKPSLKYQSAIFRLIWKLYPRWLVKMMGDRFGMCLMIEATRPS
jgi:ubiquinone/menaquinone biosynthesis C-methylase UbiE